MYLLLLKSIDADLTWLETKDYTDLDPHEIWRSFSRNHLEGSKFFESSDKIQVSDRNYRLRFLRHSTQMGYCWCQRSRWSLCALNYFVCYDRNLKTLSKTYETLYHSKEVKYDLIGKWKYFWLELVEAKDSNYYLYLKLLCWYR